MAIRVLIADDQELFRAGLRLVLRPQPDIEIVGEAPDGEHALALAARVRPDVVVMDLRMPRMDGIEATRRLTDADGGPRVLALTTFGDDEHVYAALRAGASGFLLKDAPPEELIAGIRVLARGDALLGASVTRRVIEGFVRGRPPAPAAGGLLERLTPRELEVLTLLADGRSNAEIARQLIVSEATVKTHVARTLFKLDLRDRVHAVVFAYETGLVRPGRGQAPSGT
jgi:DNA-binding NarL/FixJ family response regulator